MCCLGCMDQLPHSGETHAVSNKISMAQLTFLEHSRYTIILTYGSFVEVPKEKRRPGRLIRGEFE